MVSSPSPLLWGPIISILQLNTWELREPTNEREQGTDDNIYIKNEGIDGTQRQQSP